MKFKYVKRQYEKETMRGVADIYDTVPRMEERDDTPLDKLHFVFILLTVFTISTTVILFPYSLGRIFESVRDLGVSIAYYFLNVFGLPDLVTPTVNEVQKYPFWEWIDDFQFIKPQSTLPFEWEEFKLYMAKYRSVFFSAENLSSYVLKLFNTLYYASLIILLVAPFFLLLRLTAGNQIYKTNNDYNRQSERLLKYKRFEKRVIYRIKSKVLRLTEFMRENSYYYKIWIFVWLLNFNIISIAIEAIAFYFYFIFSFDMLHIYRQFYKLFLDLSVMFRFVPFPLWVLFGYVFIRYIRKKIGYARLEHMERKNEGFINSRPIVTMVVGLMRTGKTTCVTDMGLSITVLFRRQAMEILIEIFLKYPNFPWIILERDILAAMENHTVYNLATCRKYVDGKRVRFERYPKPKNIFGYDYNRYGLCYDDSLTVKNIWKDIEDYVKAYLIYVLESSLMITNYGVREDFVINSQGNFPLWNSDFFRRKSVDIPYISRYSHIVDYDSLRLGKKVVEDNIMKDAFDFGIILLMEIGKERGNALELREVKQMNCLANQKNDLFDNELKMIGHGATVANRCFARFVCDEQRPESWGANARELADIIRIEQKREQRLTMPFYELNDIIYSFIRSKYTDFYLQYRYNRGDVTLLFYLYTKFFNFLHRGHTKAYNTFGYYPVDISVERGTLDGEKDERKYYYMVKKIYSGRFATDGLGGFYYEKTIRSRYGIADMPSYKDIKATNEELSSQNSYFMNALDNLSNDEEEGER